MGWYGIAAGEIGWLANVTFWAAIAGLTDPGVLKAKFSLGAAVLTLIVAATTPYWNKAFLLEDEQKIVGLSFGIGYYVWMSALLLASVSLIARTFVDARRFKAAER